MIKRICELKPILFMGNFTYSTYVVQFGLVFYRTAATTKPLFVSDLVLVPLNHLNLNKIVILMVFR